MRTDIFTHIVRVIFVVCSKDFQKHQKVSRRKSFEKETSQNRVMLQRSKSQGDKSAQKGINVRPTIWKVDLQNKKPQIPIQTFTKNSYWVSVPPSVVKMDFWSTFLIFCFVSSINGQKLPNQKFVTDLVTNFNRFGIIYHLPLMKRSHIHNYYKSINQYK